MKYLILTVLLLVASFGVFADQYVQGHYRSNGTYVQGYYRSSPNSTRSDNYSTKGNINPYTGQRGYKSPYSDTYTKPYSDTYTKPYSNPYK